MRPRVEMRNKEENDGSVFLSFIEAVTGKALSSQVKEHSSGSLTSIKRPTEIYVPNIPNHSLNSASNEDNDRVIGCRNKVSSEKSLAPNKHNFREEKEMKTEVITTKIKSSTSKILPSNVIKNYNLKKQEILPNRTCRVRINGSTTTRKI
ncbi:uncharacterized protein LOC110811574 isoform X2 [Carica papaya]|uniref:uncharacterized protein LOC110811574 isoform X2 n=1 Tax=Carica papaya TaxID=3649 RepID=UPI000B8C73E9|nr:uncharacterized protein LOC110811574 isoform X2 [Carica papaya]